MSTLAQEATNIGHTPRWQILTPLLRNGYALILNTVLSSGLGLLYWTLAARFYPADVVGINSALISTMLFLSGLAELNLTNALIRFLPCAGPLTGRWIGYAYGASLAVALVVTLAFLRLPYFQRLTQDLPAMSVTLAIWFLMATLLWCIFALQDYVLIALRAALWVPVENTLFGLAKLLLLVALAAGFEQYGIFASWTLPLLLVILPINGLIFAQLVPQQIIRSEPGAPPPLFGQLLKFAAGDYVASLFMLTSITLLPLVVLSQAGRAATAYFYLAWTIAYPLQMISLNMTASLVVESAVEEARLAVYSRRILVPTFILLGLVVAVVLHYAPTILGIFGASYAAEGTTLLRLLALSALPYSINVTAVAVARVQKRMQRILLIETALAILTLSLSYLLLLYFGITGVGMAWLISQSSVAVIVGFTQVQERLTNRLIHKNPTPALP